VLRGLSIASTLDEYPNSPNSTNSIPPSTAASFIALSNRRLDRIALSNMDLMFLSSQYAAFIETYLFPQTTSTSFSFDLPVSKYDPRYLSAESVDSDRLNARNWIRFLPESVCCCMYLDVTAC
jgi:hypothetical protein